MKKISRFLALALALIMIMSMTACGGGGNDDVYEITWWIPVGEDSSYYDDYEDNPVLNYIEETYTFNGKKIEFDFFVAPPGTESEDFNTQIGTGDYCGVMDMSMTSINAIEMLEEEMIWDLSELVPAHMPNYMKLLEENPFLKEYLYTYIDGEERIISLRGFSDEVADMFQGYCYRRDWIARYGTHPVTDEAFTYGFEDESDPYSWYDNVVFPSGGDEPIYISDWEWMFRIFTKAINEQEIEDGYCFSPFYKGFMETGDLYTGFGGGSPYWYIEGDTINYGVTDDNMRAYLQCLNTWYNNGWINPSFEERAADMFFAVDTASVFQGKVGLWQGRRSTLGTQIDANDGGYSEGAVVYGCRQPINDIYGGEEQKNKTPNMMFQYSRADSQVVLTDKLSEEEVIAFLEFMDFLYSEEGALLANAGLSKEQQEQVPSVFYNEYGLTEGAYTLEEVDGKTVIHPKLNTSAPEYKAAILSRVAVRLRTESMIDYGLDRYTAQAVAAWDYYESTASVPNKVMASVNENQNQQIAKIRATLDQHLERTIGGMVKGEGYDVWDDASWQQFVKDVNKYRAGEITDIYQSILDSLE